MTDEDKKRQMQELVELTTRRNTLEYTQKRYCEDRVCLAQTFGASAFQHGIDDLQVKIRSISEDIRQLTKSLMSEEGQCNA